MKHNYILFLTIFLCANVYAQQPYYDDVDLTLTGTALRDALATKVIATHSNPLNYIWDACQNTDLDPANNSNVLLIYGWESGTDSDVTNDLFRGVNENGGNVGDWNREHTFPNSLANPDLDDNGRNMTPYSDAHNLRASDVQRNGQRGNKKFGEGSGNSSTVNGGTNWYPGDDWKGDAARIIMYMYLRYGNQCYPSLATAGSVNSVDSNMINLLLKWNSEDPVSLYEDNRNSYHDSNATYAQGNRNPFIDEPYLANIIWGIPSGQTAAEDRWNLLSTNDFTLESVKIYPNPATGNYVNIVSNRNIKAEVYDILGKKVKTQNLTSNNKKLNISELKDGVYLLKLISDTGSITKKLIKQ